MDVYKNLALAQVVTPPAPALSGTSLAITPGTGAFMPPVPFTITVFDGTAYATPINAELVRVTAIAGDTLSGLVRGWENSTPRAIVAGDYLAQTFTAQFAADVTNSGNQSAGTLPDARLSANVPLKNTPNTFAAPQTILTGQPAILLKDTPASADLGVFRIANSGNLLLLQALNDALNLASGTVYMDRAGNLVAAGLGPTPLNASQLNAGTVPDAQLSANVARRDQANTFAASQVIALPTPRLTLTDTGAAVDQRIFQILNYGQQLHIDILNDAQSAYAGPSLVLDRAGHLYVGGDLYEKGRTTPIGHWIDVPYNAANFGATGGTWTVPAGNVVRHSYALVGKTLHYQFLANATTVTVAPSSLNIVTPFTIGAGQTGTVYLNVDGASSFGVYHQPTQDIYLRFQRDPFGTPFGPGSTYVYASLTIQIL